MVIFILTRNGFSEMETFVQESNAPIWVNENVLTKTELEKHRSSGIDITDFTYHIDKENEEEVMKAISTIKEHHPEQNIWTEL